LPNRRVYGGHTLGVIADLEKRTGVTVRRIHGDKGYRGHNYPDRFKVWITGQVPRVTKAIPREMRRRAAIEPVIDHLKEDHRMGRNYLTGRDGDRINAVLAAAGYNFSCFCAGSRSFYAPCCWSPGALFPPRFT
jgi:IS5 family transposase